MDWGSFDTKHNPQAEVSTAMDDDISNALAEFSLEIMAPAVKALEASDSKVDFSQAYFVSDIAKMESLLDDVKEIITVPIRIDNVGRFYLNYLLHHKIN